MASVLPLTITVLLVRVEAPLLMPQTGTGIAMGQVEDRMRAAVKPNLPSSMVCAMLLTITAPQVLPRVVHKMLHPGTGIVSGLVADPAWPVAKLKPLLLTVFVAERTTTVRLVPVRVLLLMPVTGTGYAMVQVEDRMLSAARPNLRQ